MAVVPREDLDRPRVAEATQGNERLRLTVGISQRLDDKIEGALVAELEVAGYREAILPIVDYFAPYEPLLPAASRAELYRFADRDGELLALRADFTPLLARLLAPHLATLELPLRIFYRGDVIRASTSGRAGSSAGRVGGLDGADTEQYQLGGELLGAPADAAALEREAALLFARLFRVASGGRGRLVLGFAGALDDLLVAAAGREGAAELARAVARRERTSARGAGDSGTALLEIVESGAPRDGATLGGPGAAALRGLETLRDEIERREPGLGVAVDLAEFADFSAIGLEPGGGSSPGAAGARDLRSYYGGLVMRGYLPGVARAVASGGRYDELFRRLGGADAASVAAIGFSLRLDPFAAATPALEPAAGASR